MMQFHTSIYSGSLSLMYINTNMKLNDILVEKRRGGELNPRYNQYEQLRKYAEDPDIYISFTEIEKIGVNPRSKYRTPIGIYAYHLSTMWSGFDHENQLVRVPFAGNNPNIYVLRATEDMTSVHNYDWNRCDTDIHKASRYVLGIMNDDTDVEEYVNQISRKIDTSDAPLNVIWSYTRALAMDSVQTDAYSIRWNAILRKIGINGVVDYGEGIIHPNEPKQAVFLTTSAFTVVDRVVNPEPKLTYPKIMGMVAHIKTLLSQGRPVPKGMLGAISAGGDAATEIANHYIHYGVEVPDEVIDGVLTDGTNGQKADLYAQYTGHNLPYTDKMLKRLRSDPELIWTAISRLKHPLPDEFAQAIVGGGQDVIMHAANVSLRSGKMPHKLIHNAIMSLPVNDTSRSSYSIAALKMGVDVDKYNSG